MSNSDPIYVSSDVEPYESNCTSLCNNNDDIVDISSDEGEGPMHPFEIAFTYHSRLGAISKGNHKRLMYIYVPDIQRLPKGKWWNDMVMEFALAMWMERFLRSHLRTTPLWLLSTFFYTKYVSDGFSAIKNWSHGHDPFDNDIVIVPINLDLRWFVVAICFPAQILMQSNSSQCCIFSMDSLGSHHRDIRSKLIQWLTQEAEARGIGGCRSDILSLNLPVVEQPNLTDCGPYMVHNIDRFVRHHDRIITSVLKNSVDDLRTDMIWRSDLAPLVRDNVATQAEHYQLAWQRCNNFSS
ncbi:hypothetical protein M422DRAFT_30958 [Sphaerobolus stellatus SS14]|uniref:Ubiquitin-like protease family profile domain-containing protein n=1 Tax=Sphaerobolus stellatus (strain SS14) TaxID=990650 RepID=A0A0C9VN15_SPHS4|nr:hypothetical protein M422DRAFT_30958 [Sphaerobolus stellatus SS14]